ncbi:hypothetical protein, partial [Victivallis vadensis]|uniref:hypothetical protein n=1 Tax=Victivallis vadensis TaxID=172901 RepID=UPI003AF89337
MEKIKIAEVFSGGTDIDGLLRRKFPVLPGGEDETGFSIVPCRVFNLELDAEHGKRSRHEHPQVVVWPLIGPAALTIVSFFIQKSHIEYIFEVDSGGTRRCDLNIQPERRIADHTGIRRRSNPDDTFV